MWWKIKMFWQRGRRGWCDEDLWDLGSSVSRRLADMMDEFAERTCGYPESIGSLEKWQEEIRKCAKNLRHASKCRDSYPGHYCGKCNCNQPEALTLEGEKSKRAAFAFLEKHLFSLWD